MAPIAGWSTVSSFRCLARRSRVRRCPTATRSRGTGPTCEELGVPLCMHAGSSPRGQFAPYSGFSPTIAAALGGLTQPSSTVFVLVNLVLSRILLRHPGLKVVFAESGLGWAAYLLEYADHQFEKDRLPREGYDLTPSQQFRRQCYLTASYECDSLQTRGYI